MTVSAETLELLVSAGLSGVALVEAVRAIERKQGDLPEKAGDGELFPLGPTPENPTCRAFEEFWLAYPRKVGKLEARRKFDIAVRRLNRPDALAIMLGALARAKSGWTDPQFVPHPSTWLHQGRWDDQAPTVGAGAVSAVVFSQPTPDEARRRAERLRGS